MKNVRFSSGFLLKSLAWGASAFCSAVAFAAMEPPPLPLGSAQSKAGTGQSPVEQQRMLRAHKHHHPGHYKKDMTRDDTVDDAEPASRKRGDGKPSSR